MRSLVAAGTTAAVAPRAIAQKGPTEVARRFKLTLSPGAIGVRANQREAIQLADRHGFEAVEPFASELAGLQSTRLDELTSELKSKHLEWGAAGLAVDFRGDDAKLRDGLRSLATQAKALQKAGARRVGTWLSPSHRSLPYLQNLRLHASRLRGIAEVLRDQGLQLGLEYVGTHTLLISGRYPFVHTMAEARDLIAEIGASNVGLVLDSWHWWQAGDGADDILALKNGDIVSCDLNDAPLGVDKRNQKDGQRELPAATGVIDAKAFLGALRQIGYDGPVRAEPFNRALNELDNEPACAAVIAAMRKANGEEAPRV